MDPAMPHDIGTIQGFRFFTPQWCVKSARLGQFRLSDGCRLAEPDVELENSEIFKKIGPNVKNEIIEYLYKVNG